MRVRWLIIAIILEISNSFLFVINNEDLGEFLEIFYNSKLSHVQKSPKNGHFGVLPHHHFRLKTKFLSYLFYELECSDRHCSDSKMIPSYFLNTTLAEKIVLKKCNEKRHTM